MVELFLKANEVSNYKNVDLHSHSLISDGTLSPSDVALRAYTHGVDLWALTDHDEVSGQDEARKTALSLGMSYLCGVEISVNFINRSIHILGLGIDPNNQKLADGLQEIRDGRDVRAREIGISLAQIGIEGAYEGACKFASNPELISRTHFARFLVDSGHCSSISEVFNKYLVKGKPGFVEHRWASLSDALLWIKSAGGLAVIAHPARYRFTSNEERSLLSQFVALGGKGIEVICGSHSPHEYPKYLAIAKEFGLASSRGSDFHSIGDAPHTELGALPSLPSDTLTIWSLLQERIYEN
jgi:3',5'-nucleoside bisphosphate phosphatase